MPGPLGCPARMEYTPVPSPFFGALLREIDDLVELKYALRIFWHLHRKKGKLRFVTLAELREDPVIIGAFGKNETHVQDRLRCGLARLQQRGLFLVVTSVGRENQEVVLLNTPQNRWALEGLDKKLEEIKVSAEEVPVAVDERSNIFRLYEANIGLLTPLISEELKEAEANYPETWVEDALREAVRYNKRNWRYITRILERWAREGKDDGKSRGYSEEIGAREYLRRYGPPRRS